MVSFHSASAFPSSREGPWYPDWEHPRANMEMLTKRKIFYPAKNVIPVIHLVANPFTDNVYLSLNLN
jgi:hypothetical protein